MQWLEESEAVVVVHVGIDGDEFGGKRTNETQMMPTKSLLNFVEMYLYDELVDLLQFLRGGACEGVPLTAFNVHLHDHICIFYFQFVYDGTHAVVLLAVDGDVLLPHAKRAEVGLIGEWTLFLRLLGAVELVVSKIGVLVEYIASEGVFFLYAEVEQNGGMFDKVLAKYIPSIVSSPVSIQLAVSILNINQNTVKGMRKRAIMRQNLCTSDDFTLSSRKVLLWGMGYGDG